MLPEEYKIFYTPDERQNLIVKHLCPCLTNVTLLTPDDVLSDARIKHNRFMFYTVAFDCQRSVWDELARHRKMVCAVNQADIVPITRVSLVVKLHFLSLIGIMQKLKKKMKKF